MNTETIAPPATQPAPATPADKRRVDQYSGPLPERIFSLAAIQKAGNFSRSTLYRLRHGAGLKTITVGGVTRVRETDWLAFLDKHATAATKGADNGAA